MRTFRSVAAASLAIATTPFAAIAAHIDLMNDGEFNLNGDMAVMPVSEDSVLGGARFARVLFNNATFVRENGDDFATFRNQSGLSSAATLTYGDFDGGNGELNADFQNQWRAVAVDIRRVVGTAQLRIDYASSSGEGSSDTVGLTAPGIYELSFSDPGLDLVDFSDIDAITVRVVGVNGAEVDIGPITLIEIPAPASAALPALALAAVLRRRR